MMATDSRTVGFNADPEFADEIERYQDRRGHEYQSDAVEELVQIGLQEARSPILFRLKDRAIEGAWYLSLVGIVVIVTGFLTTALSPGNAIQIAAVLVSVGAALIAGTELVRAVGGHTHLASLKPLWRSDHD